MSNKLRSHGKSMVVWVLLAMLVLGLGGFGMTNFSGRLSAVGAVGETEITVNDYARALQAELNATPAQIGRPLTMAEAKTLGLDQQVQGQLFAQAAIAEQARVIGLSAGDLELHRQITGARAFQGLDGQFDRETYRLALRQQGMSEAQFEASLRAEIARTLLQGAVAGGVTAPAPALDAFTRYVTETRDLAWAEITEADLASPVGQPDEATLRAWHESHGDEFTSPETREIGYVWLTPAMLLDQVTLDEAALREAYQARIDEFVQPERRLVEKLVYPSTDEAAAAKARYDAGSASFADLAAERGLSLEDIDLGEPTEAELGTAGPAVFALDEPGVVGPLDTDLGPALFAMNAILPAQETSFEDARETLSGEAAIDRARRMIADMTTDLEDRLAGGATLEDMAAETAMELGKVSVAPGTDADILGYEAFREAAAKVSAEDFPELGNLDDGGVFALRLEGVTPPALIPFDQARAEVEASWRAAERTRLLSERAAEVVAAVDAGATLGSTGVLVATSARLPRGGFLEGQPPELISAAFDTAPGKAAVVLGSGTDAGRVLVVAPQAVTQTDPTAPEAAEVRAALSQQLAQSLADDMLNHYARAAQAEAGMTLDAAAINAVQAQMQ